MVYLPENGESGREIGLEPLPCPICGGKVSYQTFNVHPSCAGRIICKCGLEIRHGKEETRDELVARWNRRVEHHDGLDPREYVVGTFEPCDVEERVEPAVLDYIEANDLMDEIVLRAVKYLRDAYDWDFGDDVCECLRSALLEEIGREKLEELES